MKNEIWMNTEYKHHYVSNLGRVKSTASGIEKILKPHYVSSGAAKVTISTAKTSVKVSNLVYAAFYGSSKGKIVRHIDDNKKNCKADNLTTAEIKYKPNLILFDIPTLYKSNNDPNKCKVLLRSRQSTPTKLEDKNYQRKIAQKLDNFLLDNCPHGIYQEFKKILITRDSNINNILAIKSLDMNKFNQPNEDLINLQKELK